MIKEDKGMKNLNLRYCNKKNATQVDYLSLCVAASRGEVQLKPEVIISNCRDGYLVSKTCNARVYPKKKS